ncbi:hypothetical protein KKH36_04140 [Patescibacteria group bacterium]|nr:hypothetical protein [Patescibacteria group bacterium]
MMEEKMCACGHPCEMHEPMESSDVAVDEKIVNRERYGKCKMEGCSCTMSDGCEDFSEEEEISEMEQIEE